MGSVKRITCPACGQEFNPGGWGQHGKTLEKVAGKWYCSRKTDPNKEERRAKDYVEDGKPTDR